MEFTKGLKEQAAYIDGELLRLSADASRLSITIGVDQAEKIMDTYNKGLQKIGEEVKALLKATRVHVNQEKELQKLRRSVIAETQQQISEAEKLYGPTFPNLEEELGLNGGHHYQDETEGKDTHEPGAVAVEEVDNSFDIKDMYDLLNQSLPKLL